MDENLPHCEYQTLKALPSSRDFIVTNIWTDRLELSCMTTEITHDEAKAHVMITQRIACVVREGARGPKGGRGKLHYNRGPEWPEQWARNRFNRYFVVVDRVEAVAYGDDTIESLGKTERLAQGYGMGKDAFQQAMLDSVKNGLGMVEIGSLEGMRYISSPFADNDDPPVPGPASPPRPRNEWWRR